MSRSLARKKVESAVTRLDNNRMEANARSSMLRIFPASRPPISGVVPRYLSTR